MNTQTITIALIILGALMLVGIITTLILKKVKAHENAVTISILATSFCGLLAAGALVFLVTFNMMKDYMEIKRYKEYTFENESKTVSLTVKEYTNDKDTGFELYLNGGEKLLADVDTDAYMPFGQGEYAVEWKDDSVNIYFTFRRDDEEAQTRMCVLHFDGSFEQPIRSDRVFTPNENSSADPPISVDE